MAGTRGETMAEGDERLREHNKGEKIARIQPRCGGGGVATD